jgi:hypothetical protein
MNSHLDNHEGDSRGLVEKLEKEERRRYVERIKNEEKNT